jgi:choline dehydrogenase-like flavoprotein
VPHRAAGYQLVNGELKNQDWVAPTINTTADGALYLSLEDYIAWDRGLRAGALLKPESYGKSLKEDYRYFYGASVGMAGRGEAVPREDNLCEIYPNVVDKYGIPVLKFNVKWSDYEVNQAKHMKETFKEIMHNMGAVITWGANDDEKNQYGLAKPGEIIHEAGTVRMGSDAKKSALNSWNQAHDCKNLFVVDGGAFTSQADKNITWTILALSMRASEHIIDEMKKNNL